MSSKFKTAHTSLSLLAYGLCHAAIDASCILLVFGGIDVKSKLLTFILLYNILAFGLQLPFGWIIDKIQKPVMASAMACLTVVLGLLLFEYALLATILVGIGNALFHVGGGTIALNLAPKKASLPGVFVAPGGIGLLVGGLLATQNEFQPEVFIVLLLSMTVLLFLIKSPIVNYSKNKEHKTITSTTTLAIILILLVICVRSAVGISLEFPWKSQTTLLISLTIGIALGKGLGGFIADQFGWMKTTVTGLVIAGILLYWGSHAPMTGILGMFLLNLTMPVTLVAVSNLLPGRPGFSFGLTTFALLLGAIPTFSKFQYSFSNTTLFALIVLSALGLYIGLKQYFSLEEKK